MIYNGVPSKKVIVRVCTSDGYTQTGALLQTFVYWFVMAASSGGGAPPSYRNVTSGDQTIRQQSNGTSQQRVTPVLGADWQAKTKGQCLP